jgi:magnesium and cobalt exporter, CNNM family
VNGLFSGAEIAVVTLRKSRLAQLVEAGSGSARAVERLRGEPERFLATVQIGITVVGASAAAFGGATIATELSALLAPLPLLGPYAAELGLGAVVAAISALSIVLGELVPKSLALRAAERYALLAGRPLLALSAVARPVVWLLTSGSNLVLRPFGDRTTFAESRVSAEELEALVDEAGQVGALDKPTAEIASRALAFRDLTAGEVMVPRNRIVALDREATPDDIRRVLTEHGRARMPVYQGTLDGVVGYVVAKDMAAMAWERGLVVLQDLLRPAVFVPSTAPAVKVLRDMQRRRAPLAMVVDEHGGIAGLLTLEDLVEELVGELADEEELPEDLVVREAGGAALVSGHAPVRDVNRVLDLSLPEGEGYSTVAGLCIARIGAVPERGARIRVGDTELEITDATPRQVRRLRIRRLPA